MPQLFQKSALTLIKSPRRRAVTRDLFPQPSQAELFSAFAPNLLTLMTLGRVSETEFLEVLDYSKSGVVIDLRRFPRFDMGSLSREKVFDKFLERQITYIDFAWVEAANQGAESACPYLGPESARLRGSVMILLDDRPQTAGMGDALVRQIEALTATTWEVLRIPSFLPSVVSSSLQFG